MRICTRCKAALGDHTLYCMQCGAPAALEGRSSAPDFVQPALVGGAFLGLLSSIPLVNLGNCLCCLWVVGGGAIAALLLRRQHPAGPEAVTLGDGAFVGVLSGFFGAVVATFTSIPIRLLTAEAMRSQQETFRELLDEHPEVGGPLTDFLLRLVSPDLSAATLVATFFMNLAIFALFAMIGGILIVAFTGRREAGEAPRPGTPSA